MSKISDPIMSWNPCSYDRVIALVDYGAGNVRSVHKALEAVGAEVHLARALDGATRLDPRRGEAIPSTKGTL